jgi:hypothetical protein
MTYTDPRHHAARFAKKPPGFEPHRGKKPPVRGEVYVEILTRDAEGWAIGPRRRADLISEVEWTALAKAKAEWKLAPEIEPSPAPRQQHPHAEHLREMAEEAAAGDASDATEVS